MNQVKIDLPADTVVKEEDISFIIDIISTCAHKWREICSQSGLLPNELDEIENELKYLVGGNKRYLTEGLRAWCKISPGDRRGHHKSPRFSVLIKALRGRVVDEGALAEELSKNHCNLPSVKTEGQEKQTLSADAIKESPASPPVTGDTGATLQPTGFSSWKLLISMAVVVTIVAIFWIYMSTSCQYVCEYQLHLKSHYKNYPIAPLNKWPPTPIDEYINLTLVVQDSRRSRDEYIGHILHGNIEQLLDSRQEISIDQIFDGSHDPTSRLILVEGAPGIGKSTFAWELCRKWVEEFSSLKQYSLVILLRLREEGVQSITKVSDLFYSIGNDVIDKQSLVKEVSKNQGKNVLFILDGFDELPKKLQENGFLLNLIGRIYFPQSTVLVTSRPLATDKLLTKFHPRVIEILGFTQKSVEAFAGAIFSADKLEEFKSYISASNNPAVNSLMYIPLNAAIIVQIYLHTKSVSMLPHTLTELYIQLCLTNLKRHYPWLILKRLEDLPPNLYQHLLDLSELAFKGLENDKVIFYSIPSDLDHFGFLDAHPALYGAEVSYNFLHLTLQEFFAAYYISLLEDGLALEVFKRYGGDIRWNVVWRFVAGLTKFEPYEDLSVDEDFFLGYKSKSALSQLFIQFLFEAQSVINFIVAQGNATIETSHNWTLYDMYALGYSVAHLFPATLPLHINFQSCRFTNFLYGLDSVARSQQVNLVSCITTLRLFVCNLSYADWIRLSELISHMPCLKTLDISSQFYNNTSVVSVLEQIYHSNVTELIIDSFSFFLVVGKIPKNLPNCVFNDLVSGRLDKLTIHLNYGVDIGLLMSKLFAGVHFCSLKSLSLHCDIAIPFLNKDLHCINLTELVNNTCPIMLEIELLFGCNMTEAASQLAELLRYNKALLYLYISVPSEFEKFNGSRTMISALHENTILQIFEMEWIDDYAFCTRSRAKYMKSCDIYPRFIWKCRRSELMAEE